VGIEVAERYEIRFEIEKSIFMMNAEPKSK
jgi:hypothetical protein